MAAESAGDPHGAAVLFFHGGGQTRHAWSGALREFGGRSWHATAIDLPGHGDSDWESEGCYDLDLFATCVADAANAYPRPTLVGASLGGLASLVAIGEGMVAEPRALVLVDVTPQLEHVGLGRIREFMRLGVNGFDTFQDVADAVDSYVAERSRPEDLRGLHRNVRQRPDGRWIWHWDPRFFESVDAGDGDHSGFMPQKRLEQAASQIAVPTLLIRGARSDVVSDDGVTHLRSLIPHIDVVSVSGAGHMVAGDRNDRFNAAVTDFLTRLAPAPTNTSWSGVLGSDVAASVRVAARAGRRRLHATDSHEHLPRRSPRKRRSGIALKLPRSVHESHPWRIREIAPDFPVEDVWALPVHGRAEDFETLLNVMMSLDPASGSRSTRALWRLRETVGAWLGAVKRVLSANSGADDDVTRLPIPGTTETSLTERLPQDLRNTAADLSVESALFAPLYRTHDEYAAELSNRTVHGVLHLAWVHNGEGEYQGQMAVYVKPRGQLGSAYMALIKPFRYLIVYPALMRHLERAWDTRSGDNPRSANSALNRPICDA